MERGTERGAVARINQKRKKMSKLRTSRSAHQTLPRSRKLRILRNKKASCKIEGTRKGTFTGSSSIGAWFTCILSIIVLP